MERLTILCALAAVIVGVTHSFNPDEISCCQCSSMNPENVAKLQPQIMPSPFRIEVDPGRMAYIAGPQALDINVKLTSIYEDRKFRAFMIQARRTNSSLNTIEPIGTFTPLADKGGDPVQGIQECFRNQRWAAFLSTDYTPKSNVSLVWNPPETYQGHIEFRVTFIEDENLYWVKEKSRPIYDSSEGIPHGAGPKYIAPPVKGIDVSGCGSTKGCYRVPEDCREIECQYIFTWQDQGASMEFEMSALTDGFNDRYFAVGFSDDIYCGGELVFECVHNSTSERVDVYQSFNVEEGNKNVRLNKPKIGINSEEGSYNNGRLRCRFNRAKSINDAEVGQFGLISRAWHIIMARGPAWRGEIKRHGLTVGHLPVVSPDEVDLLVNDDVSGQARYHLVKAHACLMLIAWIFFAPIGLIWMKYYTTMWPNSRWLGERYWFVAHFNCTFWVVLLVVISVILIFIEAGGWSEFPDLPQRAHPILGIIVFICVLIIPIIALIRCPETHTCRPVGNWFYWLFWTIAFCLAIPNIFIGMDFGKAMVPWWLTWILCIFFIFNLVCEVILEVHQCCTHKKNKERRKKYELQKKENPNVHIPEPWPVGRNFKRNVLYTHFIVCLIVVIISVIVVAVS